jgi:hypothetical protein
VRLTTFYDVLCSLQSIVLVIEPSTLHQNLHYDTQHIA